MLHYRHPILIAASTQKLMHFNINREKDADAGEDVSDDSDELPFKSAHRSCLLLRTQQRSIQHVAHTYISAFRASLLFLRYLPLILSYYP